VTQRVASVIATDKGVVLDTMSGVALPVAGSRRSVDEIGEHIRTIAIGIVLVLFFIRLILPFHPRAGSYRRGGGWWIGPTMGGGSWGGGGFCGGGGGGGFGGFGGGSFGGGGASGSW